MEPTTAAIILLFVISIFSVMGGNKGYQQPSRPVFPVEAIHQEVSVAEPPPGFSAVGDDVTPAIQRFILKQRPQSDVAQEIASSIVRHSQTYDINPKLVAALIARESKFNPRATSSSGAIGLGQLLPSTAKGLGLDNPYDIDQNAKGTVRYLKSLLDRFKGKVSSAIAAYLEGPNAVSQQGGFSSHSRAYVEDILTLYQKI